MHLTCIAVYFRGVLALACNIYSAFKAITRPLLTSEGNQNKGVRLQVYLVLASRSLNCNGLLCFANIHRNTIKMYIIMRNQIYTIKVMKFKHGYGQTYCNLAPLPTHCNPTHISNGRKNKKYEAHLNLFLRKPNGVLRFHQQR